MNLLLECAIRAVCIALAVAAVTRALRIRSAAAKHAAWRAALTAMLLLPGIAAWAPRTELRILPPLPEAIDAPAVEDPAPQAGPPGPPPSQAAAAAQEARGDAWPVETALAAGYLAGALFLLTRLLLGTARAASLRKRARKEHDFFSTAECAAPVTAGWLRPVILLPASWPRWRQGELEAVLAHEREHARRRDPLTQWLAALNRCVFWFHPVAWWLERKLAALAEQACDDAVLSAGHDRQDYAECLLRQAQAIRRAGARIAVPGVSVGGGDLAQRIRRILDAAPAPATGRLQATACAALCVSAIGLLGACNLGRVERAAPGQPSMNELMHRRASRDRESSAKYEALARRAKTLTGEEARSLLEEMKRNPDEGTRTLLMRHYRDRGNLKDLNAMRLWLIKQHPAGKLAPGNIDPRYDLQAYQAGKKLWLSHVKRPGASPEIYQRASHFLEGADKPLAGEVLAAGSKAHPEDPRWAGLLAGHYGRVLLGAGEPLTENNVFRLASAEEARSPYAREVRARLLASNDARLLALTGQQLLSGRRPDGREGEDALRLARTCFERAQSLEPGSDAVARMGFRLQQVEFYQRKVELSALPPAELAKLSDGDRLLLALHKMRASWIRQEEDAAESSANEALGLAARIPKDALSAEAVFEGNIVLGKAALRGGNKKEAVRRLLAAADAPAHGPVQRGEFEMNLPRALVDWGERTAVADFLERLAPKTVREQQFREWAAEIRKGINPDMIPTFSSHLCRRGPC